MTSYKASPVGNEITCVMHGIAPGLLNNAELLEKLLVLAAQKEKFLIISKLTHKFQPQGVSIIFLIQESHITVHTYPEYGSLVFSLYSCRRAYDGRESVEFFRNAICAKRVYCVENQVRVGDLFYKEDSTR